VTVIESIALLILAIGLALMTMMIVIESEPGALPLLLVLLGSVGYLVARIRGRARCD
jgi:hypothetical protein